MGVNNSNNKKSNKDITEINIIYNINKKEYNYKSIKLFGDEFVRNNKKICKMIIDNNNYEITEEYNVKIIKKIN